MHEPKFGKKCYDCTHRFVCWTNREELPEVTGLPRCTKCQTQVETVGEAYKKYLGGIEILFVKARCPEKKWWNFHDAGKYMQVSGGEWVFAWRW